MAPLPFLGPTPVLVNGRAFDPLLTHEWISAPDSSHRKRTLVLCFDGTGESFDADNSNIPQFLAMLRKDDPTQQAVYYQAGIGTYTSSVLKTPILESISKTLDLMFASDIGNHIQGIYVFDAKLLVNRTLTPDLKEAYHSQLDRLGDNICIFGFSRGAMTARALAGMVQKVGLLPLFNLEQLPFAYAMYTREDFDGLMLSVQFKRTFSIDVRIMFLGVWDTVHSVGLIEKHLPFSGTNNAIVNFRHALALDERRVKFRPFFCTGGRAKEDEERIKVSEHNKDDSEDTLHMIERRESSGIVQDFEEGENSKDGLETDVVEVFFSGAHCDVGGGSVKNGERHSLARIPLRWMIRECFRTKTGIIFDAHMLRNECGLDIDHILRVPPALLPETLHLRRPHGAELEGFSFRHVPVAVISGLGSPFRWAWSKLSGLRLHDSKKQFVSTVEQLERRKPPPLGEDREELYDALSPIFDQIKMHPEWNVIEWIPWLVKRQEVEQADNFWAYKWIWNRGKGREVYEGVMKRGIKVHRSVKARMLAFPMDRSNELYVPKIRFTIGGEVRRLSREEWLADKPEYFDWVD